MVNFNGDLLPDSSHFLNHKNRGLQFGDALSERIRYTGRTLLFWEEHYFRLMASMRQLRMEIPMEFTLEHLEEEILKTIEASGRAGDPNEISVTVFRAEGTGLLPDTLLVSFIIDVAPLSKAEYTLKTPGLKADLFKDYYVQADGLSRLPHNSKLPLVLASIFARENGYGTCLILNHRKEIALGLHGNLFYRKGTEIKTPPLSNGCPDGILRKFLLKQSWENTPYQLTEADISPFELQQADELFMTDISTGITAIGQYRKAQYTLEAALFTSKMINEFVRSAD
ncbi:aminotransferase class IV [Robiginitalea aurantiaca]|uniref:branched-chain-amino-acid transaminase n=1 Tax=Robiginitalea aurantiaca TaxID=3056915 RepID=A0ABT7WH05_9FLAO|nr:aminotransferase class IV [Robiginitalea aurantiaca]MDM9632208.1 aminotransferase class IV [Robiginitalea aurantiaca]